jgi:hypothetical protein
LVWTWILRVRVGVDLELQNSGVVRHGTCLMLRSLSLPLQVGLQI